MTAGRGIILLTLCISPFIAQASLTGSAPNKNGWCYGYNSDKSDYCWLTYDGKEFAKDGKYGYKCSSWDGHSIEKYCFGCSTVCAKTFSGSSKNGGVSVSGGLCKAYASKSYGGKHYCGNGAGYKNGGTKCTSLRICSNSGAAPAPKPAPAPAAKTSSGGYYAGWGLNWIVKKKCYGKNSFKVLAKLVCKYYGTGRYGWGWGGGKTTVTCGSKKVSFKVVNGCWKVVSSIPGGGAPKPANPKPPSELQGFIASWIPHQLGKSVQRIGETRKYRLECWDLAARAVDEANQNGFNVGIGKSGGSAKWIWSNKEINPKAAKAGDIAQFSYYKAKYSYTGSQHTAVVLKDFDSSSCSITMYDQNPKPVHQTVYYPPGCPGYKSGAFKIYRLVSSSKSPWARLDDEDEVDDMPAWTPDDLDEESNVPIAMMTAGAIAAMAGLGFVAFRATRKSSRQDRELLINVEDGGDAVEEAEAAE